MPVLWLASLVGLLGGRDPQRFQTWRADGPRARIELSEALAAVEMPRLSTAALAESVILDRDDPQVWGEALTRYPLSLRGEPAAMLGFATLDGVASGALNPAARSRLSFLVGQSLLAASRPSQAQAPLLQVARDSVAFPAARYLLGVALLSAEGPLDLRRAAAHFTDAIQTAETSPQASAPVVMEARRLSLLGLARLFYEAGEYEVALYYYRRLPATAPERAEVAFESAWAHVMRGDMQRALGETHGASAPLVRHPGRPELRLVAGAALLALCQYQRGRMELDILETEFLVHLPRLGIFRSGWRAADGAKGAMAALDETRSLPPRLRSLLREQPAVAHGLREKAAVADEVARARALAGPAGVAAERLGGELDAWHRTRLDRAVAEAVDRLVVDFERLRDARGELMIDLLEAEGQQIAAEIEAGEAQTRIAPGAEVPVLGDDWQRWSFSGDWWFDELGSYRSTLPSLCRVEGGRP